MDFNPLPTRAAIPDPRSPVWGRGRRLGLAAAVLGVVAVTACGGGDDGVAAGAAAVTVGPAPVSETGGAPAPSPAPVSLPGLDASTTCGLPDFRNQLLQHINAARAVARSCGAVAMPAAAPLVWSDRLFAAAAKHSTDMAVNNYFSHTGLDGRRSAERVTDEGYAWTAVGENIAAGQASVGAVMTGWLASDGHCQNIMRAAYSEVAVGCAQRTGSTYGRYWTMVLAHPRP